MIERIVSGVIYLTLLLTFVTGLACVLVYPMIVGEIPWIYIQQRWVWFTMALLAFLGLVVMMVVDSDI